MNGFLSREGRSAMERSFALRTTIAHESLGLDARIGGEIRVGAILKQNLNDQVLHQPG